MLIFRLLGLGYRCFYLYYSVLQLRQLANSIISLFPLPSSLSPSAIYIHTYIHARAIFVYHDVVVIFSVVESSSVRKFVVSCARAEVKRFI